MINESPQLSLPTYDGLDVGLILEDFPRLREKGMSASSK